MLIKRLLSQSGSGAQVAGFAGQAFGYSAALGSPLRDAPRFGPYGYAARPPEGEQALLLPLGEGWICQGCLEGESSLQPGEIRLRSLGGAEILLQNSGEISLNGLIITKDGVLLPKEGSESTL